MCSSDLQLESLVEELLYFLIPILLLLVVGSQHKEELLRVIQLLPPIFDDHLPFLVAHVGKLNLGLLCCLSLVDPVG